MLLLNESNRSALTRTGEESEPTTATTDCQVARPTLTREGG